MSGPGAEAVHKALTNGTPVLSVMESEYAELESDMPEGYEEGEGACGAGQIGDTGIDLRCAKGGSV